MFRLLCLAAIACSQSGCSLFVMAGKMFFGDPKIACAFRQRTGVDLTKGREKVLVVCSTPEAIRGDYSSLDFDLADGVIRRLKRRGIEVVDPDELATWMDDNGGEWSNPSELARQFDADYIVHVDLNRFEYREENSPTLFRGRASGSVFAYEVRRTEGQKEAVEVFVSEFNSEHPKGYPISTDRMSAKSFRKQYLDRISGQLAQLFCDHRASEGIE